MLAFFFFPATFLNARSKSSGASLASSFFAVSMNRLCCLAGVSLRFRTAVLRGMSGVYHRRRPRQTHQPRLEPIPKDVESDESVVIPYVAPESLPRGAACGSLNIAVPPIVAACVIRVI
ncbi:MAG: hypothetical protein ACREED_07435 [Stellaceae bacterium]